MEGLLEGLPDVSQTAKVINALTNVVAESRKIVNAGHMMKIPGDGAVKDATAAGTRAVALIALTSAIVKGDKGALEPNTLEQFCHSWFQLMSKL